MQNEKPKMLYIHGMGSSARTQTVSRLRQSWTMLEVHAIDVDHHPQSSVALIEQYVAEHGIQLLMGTSLGGFYTLCADVDIVKIAINPANDPAHDLDKPSIMGRHEYFNPRADGNQWFEFQREDLLPFKSMALHITPKTYIIASDHDELLGDKRAAYSNLVGNRFTVTSQIGHRTTPDFTAPMTGDLWRLVTSLLSQDLL